MRRLEDDLGLRRQNDGLVQSLVELRRGDPDEVAVTLLEGAQDEVASLDRRRQRLAVDRLGRHNEAACGVGLGPLEEVVRVGRLWQAG